MAAARLSWIMVMLLGVPVFAVPAEPCSCDPAAQTEMLHQRLESLRKRSGVALSFTVRSFLVYHSDTQLRFNDCTYQATGDISGVVDILLAAKIIVGYPPGWENYQPEAGFGIYFRANQPDALDLWFSNPMHHHSDTDWVAVGQSHDRGEVTAYKISASPTLRNELWDWALAHAYPTQETAAECQLIKKYIESGRPSKQ
jgi:hypothetical protein